MLDPIQIRAGRSLLGWSARELAERTGLHITTIQRLERNREQLRGHATTLDRIRRALESAGVELLDANDSGAGPGVRIKSVDMVAPDRGRSASD